MKSKRFLCLLLVLLMVFSLTPSETRAETTVYFTAVNDQLLPDLSDETMPFWSGGRLYIPSTVVTGTDLGLFYSRSRDKSTAVVYRQGSALTFNFAAGTVADQNDRQYSGPAIVRSDVVFLPLDLLTQFFSLDYSYTRVTYGYLVRVKSDTVVLSDAKFIDAAAMSMEQRYNEYMKTHSESNDPGNTPDQNTDGDRDLVCLALPVPDAVTITPSGIGSKSITPFFAQYSSHTSFSLTAAMEIALLQSITEPPPTARIQSTCFSFTSFVPSSTFL